MGIQIPHRLVLAKSFNSSKDLLEYAYYRHSGGDPATIIQLSMAEVPWNTLSRDILLTESLKSGVGDNTIERKIQLRIVKWTESNARRVGEIDYRRLRTSLSMECVSTKRAIIFTQTCLAGLVLYGLYSGIGDKLSNYINGKTMAEFEHSAPAMALHQRNFTEHFANFLIAGDSSAVKSEALSLN